MKQIRTMLERLKNPTVVMSIVSQIAAILVLLNVTVDVDLLTNITVSVCSIFVLLGIMSNQTTKRLDFCDDICKCPCCGKKQLCAHVAGEMICTVCGTKCSGCTESE